MKDPIALASAPPNVRSGRPRLACERAKTAWQMLANCDFCNHHCGANRLAGDLGPCRAGPETRFFCAQVEVSDELELIPVFAVALSGCDLRCDFCITGASSWNPRAGTGFDARGMALQAQRALAAGARTIMVLGGEPTIHLPSVLAFIAQLPSTARLAWKTNAHCSAPARRLLEGVVDVWVADFKFGNDACAERLARVSNYLAAVRENLLWASRHCDLIVRHLLMPGHVDCCWQRVAQWVANHLPRVRVNLRTGFWPAWRSARHPELGAPLDPAECDRAHQIARALALNLVD